MAESLKQMNALDLIDRSFVTLSDGERQKVMVARALAQEPLVLLLDEPTAFLDWTNRVNLMVSLKKIVQDTGKAVLVSSHDLELVTQIADQLWIMNSDRKIIAGKCEELIRSGELEKAFPIP